MRNLAILFIHLIATLARLLGPGGVRSIVAESLLLKHQLLIVNRSRQRSPNLSAWDRIFAGWMALLVRPTRLLGSAIVLKPSTLLGTEYTRRILGFGVHAGTVDGVALCRMFNRAIRGHRWLPKYLSSDNDPLYRFHQWQANLSFRAYGPRKLMKIMQS